MRLCVTAMQVYVVKSPFQQVRLHSNQVATKRGRGLQPIRFLVLILAAAAAAAVGGGAGAAAGILVGP